MKKIISMMTPSITIAIAFLAYLCIVAWFIGLGLECLYWLHHATWPSWSPEDFGFHPPYTPYLGINRLLAWFYEMGFPWLALFAGILVLSLMQMEGAARGVAEFIFISGSGVIAFFALTPFLLLLLRDVPMTELIKWPAENPAWFAGWLASVVAAGGIAYMLWRHRSPPNTTDNPGEGD